MRGATAACKEAAGITDISTHTPHAGRDCQLAENLFNAFISTHTPHAGRDKFCCYRVYKF